MSSPSQSSPAGAGPWPVAVGLLAACVTTVIGILSGNEPETILYRCFVAGVVVASVAAFMRGLWQLIHPGGST